MDQFNAKFGSSQENSDSAILFINENDSFGQTPFVQSARTPAPVKAPDGHQILDQVQKELQFLPTNEHQFVTGTISASAVNSGNSNPASLQSTSSRLSGPMDQPTDFAADTSYLIGTETINLDSSSSASNTFGGNKGKFSIWQFEYYTQYFDLSTDIFYRRVLWSLLPLTGENKGTYIERHIQSNPDLFGPFWISLTLALIATICDNIVTYFNQFELTEPTSIPNCNASWTNCSMVKSSPGTLNTHIPYRRLGFTFERMNLAMLITFGYVFLMPLTLWFFCNWRACSKLYSFLECLCAYGYSLSGFVFAYLLFLLLIPIIGNSRELQFILFASVAFLSATVSLVSFAPMVLSDRGVTKIGYIALLCILFAHLILALFYLFIFL